MAKSKKMQRIKQIEYHLRNYHTYKVGIKNLMKQLDHIMPSMTASYDITGSSSGTFNIKSETENFAIDRIESRKALDLHEDIKRYELIINAIDESLNSLNDIEYEFIQNRYIEGKTIANTAMELGYSDKHIFNIRNSAFSKLLISLKGILQL
ncbi:sigma-70 family RNA polymerase sigma factor [Virgibacillus salexigens]|uniref:Sigma-70 family RNA polymerase sigma factor n=1 Tax=Virgibacillus kapii TaxID=1638645 RepID=A0ABQ2DZX5_9BACI|nr:MULTISPECIES: sigma-70 family RNA polymerase sigma factor [Virgibacillus]MYL43928.1 sigma-70 family RNA polymerase sigma factor [Virgibacillus massiliensis]GGJ76979.1 hypothetical protein GCM10007111_43280 [Virgibacillus kapii]